MKKDTFLTYAVSILLFAVVDAAHSRDWQLTTSPELNWRAIASSADGTKLVAGAWLAPLFLSADSGMSWVKATNTPAAMWQSVASSADGTTLVASATDPAIWVSNDSGATWTNSGPYISYASAWGPVASSADGTKLVAAMIEVFGFGGPVFLSTNSGATWAQANAPSNYWWAGASSADGSKLTLGGSPGPLYTSTNSGATWTSNNVPPQDWEAIASSADGNKVVAITLAGLVYTTADAGVTWIQRTNIPLLCCTSCRAVTSSADGTKLALGANTGFEPKLLNTYTSADSGITWVQDVRAPSVTWMSLAMSADGSKLAGVSHYQAGSSAGSGWAYVSRSAAAPILNISPSTTNALLSWIVPSTPLVLQQNSDLTTTNWGNVSTPPALNLSNLRNEVIVSSPNNKGFYRLASP